MCIRENETETPVIPSDDFELSFPSYGTIRQKNSAAVPEGIGCAVDDDQIKRLIQCAISAREFAYAPYSSYRVGAALLTADCQVYTGCNVESSSYSPTCCAERVAVFKAVSEGKRDFAAMALAGGEKDGLSLKCTPCGVCRQVLSEFCHEDFPIYVTDGKRVIRYTLARLLPHSFSL